MDFAVIIPDFYAIWRGTVNQNRILAICLIVFIIIFIFIQPAYVGPGGLITKSLLKIIWVKAALAIMALTCLSLAIYVYVREQIVGDQSFKHLRRKL